MRMGQGPGLPNTTLGQKQGSPSTTLTVAQMPAHSHTLNGTSSGPNAASPNNGLLPTFPNQQIYAPNASPNAEMAPSIGPTGGGIAFTQYQPTLALTYCIATSGIFPSRN